MPGLSAHLRDRDAHARLSFHPECPICRDERLLGTVTSHAVVSQRTGSALAAAALAVATMSPAAALATEPDNEREGATEPTDAAAVDVTPPAAGDGAHVTVFDPGGDAADSPMDAPQDDDDDAEPDDDPALDDPDAPPVDDDGAPGAVEHRDQPADPPAAQPRPAQPAPAPAPQPQQPPAAPATDPAPPAIPAQQPPPPAALPSASPPAPRAPVLRHAPGRARAAQAPRSARAQPDTTAHAAAPAPTPRPPTSTTAPPADNADRPSQPDHGDRTHTVQAGESLWSIAADVLGPDARPFQIAREVQRLWQLNKERIATGDPDLLMIDTRLRLR